MFLKKFRFLQLSLFLAFSQMVWSKPIHPDSEDLDHLEYLNSRLSYYTKRFTIMLRDPHPTYGADVKNLVKRFESAAGTSVDLLEKEALLKQYSEQLPPDFAAYLQSQLDVQLLNEDIAMEVWYLRQLLPQLDDAQLATEIAKVLPRLQLAQNAVELDEKYELFVSTEENFSRRLLEFLDATPEPEALLNAHLQFFREFLMYLLQERMACAFEPDVRQLLAQLEEALSRSRNAVPEKLRLLDRFDDLDTQFGRFLNYKVNEFEIYKFSV